MVMDMEQNPQLLSPFFPKREDQELFYLHSQLHLELPPLYPPILYLLSLLIPHSPHLPPYLVTMPKVKFPAHSLPWNPPLHYKEGRQAANTTSNRTSKS
uniref:Uncharacterized protein n=1 Tax=Picea glauca TaxID=3330 RepID=A0A117NGY4_PICGL|nr:hypothetical protein ABT39_MTgene5697 [Picea glauca]